MFLKAYSEIGVNYFAKKFQFFSIAFVTASAAASAHSSGAANSKDTAECIRYMELLPSKPADAKPQEYCGKSQRIEACTSTEGRPIYHFDFSGAKETATHHQRSVLVFAVTHGDEPESGTVALRWMQRLEKLQPRNSWRIVPVLNPDGLLQKKRVNANGVDINRNFPSKDWNAQAQNYWNKGNKDPRKFPGSTPASEAETRCAMDQIAQYKPDFIVSIHTPYGILDFDGPKMTYPDFKHLKWANLGTYPGSLGRYMWKDQSIPVLTIELKDDKLLSQLDQLDLLQDISGSLAISSGAPSSNKNKLSR